MFTALLTAYLASSHTSPYFSAYTWRKTWPFMSIIIESVHFFPNIQGVDESQAFRYNLLIWALRFFILFATDTHSQIHSQVFTKLTMW